MQQDKKGAHHEPCAHYRGQRGSGSAAFLAEIGRVEVWASGFQHQLDRVVEDKIKGLGFGADDYLRSLGLGKYEAAFRENEIDETVLPNLTAEDLKELGVSSLGHRRKLLDAIAALRTDGGVQPPSLTAATSAANGCDANCRARRRSRWRAPTCHGDVLRSCGFD